MPIILMIVILMMSSMMMGFSTQLAAQSIVVRDRNGAVVGYYAGEVTGSGSTGVRVVSTAGYVAVFDETSGQMLSNGYSIGGGSPIGGPGAISLFIKFDTTDCSGMGVLAGSVSPIDVSSFGSSGGFIFPYFPYNPPNSLARDFIYIPKGVPENTLVGGSGSYFSPLGCVPTAIAPQTGVSAGFNDPSVTGFSGSVPGPLTLGMLVLPRPDVLFDDSFEIV